MTTTDDTLRARLTRAASFRILTLGLLAATFGCAGLTERGSGRLPGWVSSPPVESGWVHAVGHSTGALYPDDNLRYALDDGRAHLAKALEIDIEQTVVLQVRNEDANFESETVIEGTGRITNIHHLATYEQKSDDGRVEVWVLLKAQAR